MKKLILLLIVVLVVVFFGLSFFSSNDDHEAEKLLYRAMKTNSKIAANPDVAPPAVLNSIERDLKKLVEKYPDTEVAKTGALSLAEFYLSHKEHKKALEVADNMLEQYKDDAAIASKAQFLKGLIYEKNGDWSNALVEFEELQNKYLFTHLGIQAPLYITNHYLLSGEAEQAAGAHEKAIAFYDKMEKEYTGKNLGYVSATLMLQTDLRAEHYEGAAKTIELTLQKYPSALSYNQLLPHVEPIFIGKLGQPERAIAIYRSIMNKINDKKAIAVLQKKIESIENAAKTK